MKFRFSVDVTDMGDAQVRFPIAVPPGVNGLQPNVSISYSSGGDRDIEEESRVQSLIGYGWQLSGLSNLERCRAGVSGTVDMTNADRLCLGKTPLMLKSGTYWGAGSVYQTETGQIEVKQSGSGASKYFIAYLPSGHKVWYGDTTDSRVIASGSSNARVWSYRKHRDEFGNYLYVNYDKPASNGQNYPVQISYNSVKVEMFYESRTDLSNVAVPYPGLSIQKRQVALSRIDVKVDNKMVREYRLVNKLSGHGYMMLEDVQLCGYDEAGTNRVCLPSASIGWQYLSSASSVYKNIVNTVVSSYGDANDFIYTLIDSSGSSDHALHWDISVTPTSWSFGSYTQPSDVAVRTGGSHALVGELRTPDGSGGYLRRTYRYTGYPLYSTHNRGFVGFPASRMEIHDVPFYNEQSDQNDTSTLRFERQFRLDEYVAGRLGREVGYEWKPEASAFKESYRLEKSWTIKSLAHGIVFPFLDREYVWRRELTSGNDIRWYGVDVTKRVYCFRALSGDTCPSSGSEFTYPTQLSKTEQTVNKLESIKSSSLWGGIGSRSVDQEQDTKQVITNLSSITASDDWALAFPVKQLFKSGVSSAYQLVFQTDFEREPSSFGNTVKRIHRFVGNALYASTETIAHDGFGNKTSSTLTGTGITSRTESATSFLDAVAAQAVTNAEGHGSSLSYDLRFYSPKTVTDPNGNVTSVAYDGFGRVVQTTEPDGTTTDYTYDTCGGGACNVVTWAVPRLRLTVEINNSGQVEPRVRTYYDGNGREVLREVEAFDSADGWVSRQTRYDRMGRVSQRSQPYHSVGGSPVFTTYFYGWKDRLLRLDLPNGGVESTKYYATNGGALYAEFTDANSNKKLSQFDALERLKSTTDGYGSADTSGTTYTYHHLGGLDRIHFNGFQVADMDYDSAGYRTQIVEPSSGTTLFAYDALGNVLQTTDAKGQKIKTTYDRLNRPTQRIDDWLGSNPVTNTWVWDTATNGIGYLKQSDNGVLSQTYTYDTLSRLDTVTSVVSVLGLPGSNTYITDVDYDGQGRPHRITYPDNIQITQTYTSRGYADQTKRGSTVLEDVGEMNAYGQITKEYYGNGVRTFKQFDALTGELQSIETGKSTSPRSIQDYEYQWRQNGSLLKRTHQRGTTGTSDDRVESFSYDSMNRLTGSSLVGSGINHTRTFEYDQYGNITKKSGGGQNHLDYFYPESSAPYQVA